MTTYEAVAAGVRGALAAHAQAQDDGRTEDIIALYAPDGVLEVPGIGTFEGTDAIRKAWDEWKPRRPQRHMVTNTVITDWNNEEAGATSDVVFFQLGESGWSIQIVARYSDRFRCTDGKWLFSRRSDEYVGWQPSAQDG
jgi:hypothetical protein